MCELSGECETIEVDRESIELVSKYLNRKLYHFLSVDEFVRSALHYAVAQRAHSDEVDPE